MTHSPRIGVVLAGGGARGAYEAGVLATLLPALERAGERPNVFVGTSAGAINAVLFASLAHLPAVEAAEQAWAVWAHIYRKDVIAPILNSGFKAGLQYFAQLLGVKQHIAGVLTAEPLAHTLAQRMNWHDLHENIRLQRGLELVAVTATTCHSSRSAVFYQERASNRATIYHDDTRAIDYIPTHLLPEHVLASAAIPVLFPPIYVHQPPTSAGWYMDGGVRMNAPIKPAITLGVDKLIIIAGDPLEHTETEAVSQQAPDVYDAISHMLKAALTDRMVEDVHTLRKINKLLFNAQSDQTHTSRNNRNYRCLPWMFIGPRLGSHLAKTAELVFQRNYGHTRWWHRHWDFPFLHQLVHGDSSRRGELMSYLFFHHEFMQEALTMGKKDAQKILGEPGSPLPWRTT